MKTFSKSNVFNLGLEKRLDPILLFVQKFTFIFIILSNVACHALTCPMGCGKLCPKYKCIGSATVWTPT
ncbi:hypothetical protein KL86CLO1_13054 [uncultured Eubacteriales bacterium]|uniref:Uncharacterized protein n=1 Tax=uncultured Eubacteriales bacterium TaxID=172733 RepID=A0A212KGB9_9FIRM|nr:hypothetical protein KL86CLO1_13054 [uncultured Eubacteriales bacterium]